VRPLEKIYVVVFMDAIHFHVRSEGQIIKKAVYIVIGVQMDGIRDVLGMWVGENESAKFWLGILNSLRNRGIRRYLNCLCRWPCWFCQRHCIHLNPVRAGLPDRVDYHGVATSSIRQVRAISLILTIF
jgi:hypothetical protein